MVSKNTAESLRDLLSIGTDIAVREQTNEYVDRQGKQHANDILQSNLKTTFDESGYNPELLARVSNQATYGSLQSNIQAWGNKINTDVSNRVNEDPTAYAQSLASDTYSMIKAIDTTTKGSQRSALYNTLDKTIQKAQKTQLDGNVKYTSTIARNQTYANVGSIIDGVKGLSTEEATFQLDSMLDEYAQGTTMNANEYIKSISDSIIGRVGEGNLDLGKVIQQSKYKDTVNALDLRKAIRTGQNELNKKLKATDNPGKLNDQDAKALFEKDYSDWLRANPGGTSLTFLKDYTSTLRKYNANFFQNYLGFDSISVTKSQADPARNKIVDANRELFVQQIAALSEGGMDYTTIKQKLKNNPQLSAVVAMIENNGNPESYFANMDVKIEREALKEIAGNETIEENRNRATEDTVRLLTERVQNMGVEGFWTTLTDTFGGLDEPFLDSERAVQEQIQPKFSDYYPIIRTALINKERTDPTFDMHDPDDKEVFLTENFTVDAIGDSVSISRANKPTFSGDRDRWETKDLVDTLVNTHIRPAVVNMLPEIPNTGKNLSYTLKRTSDNNSIEMLLDVRDIKTGKRTTNKVQSGIYKNEQGTWSVLSSEEYADYVANPTKYEDKGITRAPMLWKLDTAIDDDGIPKPEMKLASQEELTRYYNGEMSSEEVMDWRQTSHLGGFKMNPTDFDAYADQQQTYDRLNHVVNKAKRNFYNWLDK